MEDRLSIVWGKKIKRIIVTLSKTEKNANLKNINLSNVSFLVNEVLTKAKPYQASSR